MRSIQIVALTFAVLIAYNGKALAENKITLDKVDSVNAGEGTGEGTITLDPMWTVKKDGVQLIFRQKGVIKKSVICDYGKTAYKGLAIQLNSGETYQVQASMLITHPNLGEDLKISVEKDLTIK
jgi:hypothetical protein